MLKEYIQFDVRDVTDDRLNVESDNVETKQLITKKNKSSAQNTPKEKPQINKIGNKVFVFESEDDDLEDRPSVEKNIKTKKSATKNKPKNTGRPSVKPKGKRQAERKNKSSSSKKVCKLT